MVATHLLQYFSVSHASFCLLRKERMHYVIAYCLEQDPKNVQAREKYIVGCANNLAYKTYKSMDISEPFYLPSSPRSISRCDCQTTR